MVATSSSPQQFQQNVAGASDLNSVMLFSTTVVVIVGFSASEFLRVGLSLFLPESCDDISGLEKAGARLLSEVLPSFCVYNPISIATLTRDKDELNKYKSSPLVHSYISLSLAGDFANFEPYFSNKANFDKIKSPLLVMHGSADRMTSPEASKKFVENQKVYITH